MKKPVFTKLLQICMVVDDLEAYIKRYEEDYGIGPWTVIECNKDNISDMTVMGKKLDFAMRVAVCDFANTQFELLQPTDDNNLFMDFLKKHGPGLHHVAFDTQGYDQTIEGLAARGYEVIQSGVDGTGLTFSYVDLNKDLGMVVELYKQPE
ncbi:MAG: glyoxalase [Clostridiaceae bacterium]|nr:glyoxalase [Clostridiaceae bacterium]